MKKTLLILLVITLFFTSGCWDKQEIEQILYVTEIGIDVNKEEDKDPLDTMLITYQYPNINALGKNAGGDQKSYLLSMASGSIFQAGRNLLNKTPYPFYYKHLKVIILGEDLLREGELIRSVLDELNRDTKINKRVRLLAARGDALDILEANYVEEQRTEGTIYSTLRDNINSSGFTVKTLTDLITEFDIAGASLIPVINLDEDGDYVITGGCILKDYRFLDWITRQENKVINLINSDMGQETVEVIHKDNVITYAIRNSTSKKKIKLDDKITVDLDIRVEGYLQGYTLSDEQTLYDSHKLEEIEKSIEKALKEKIEQTIAHLKEIKADIIGVGEHLSKFEPKTWKEIRNNWDSIFPEVDFNVNVDVKIRRTGLTK